MLQPDSLSVWIKEPYFSLEKREVSITCIGDVSRTVAICQESRLGRDSLPVQVLPSNKATKPSQQAKLEVFIIPLLDLQTWWEAW